MAVLIVSRDSGYADSVRAYAVRVDGIKVGELKSGETKHFSVSPGPHEILLKIDWCGSKVLKINATEDAPLSFHASSNLRGWRILMGFWYAFIERDAYLLLEQTSN